MDKPFSTPRRAWRATRVALHAIEGLATTMVVFPFVDATSKRRLTRRWSERLLELLQVHARVQGRLEVGEGNVLIVANHISWLDIFVLNAQHPVRFVAKAELGRWPLAGRLARNAGTIFVSRERRHDTRRVNHNASQALSGGDIVAVFPEGTTTDGSTLLKFHGSLLQPIVESHGRVQPIAIRYRDARGAPSTAPAYVGEDSFARSFWRVCGLRELFVELIATAPIPAKDLHRRELARQAEAAIRTALGLSVVVTAPDRRVDPAVALP